MARQAVRLRIEGGVQGVGYRWWAIGAARSLGLDGWVRNCRDGSVEILAIGDPQAVDDMARACAMGPRPARVTAVVRAAADDDGSTGFEQKATV
ncbi:MAG: acylphosphatase [Phenylobacterium sp.]